jgi:2-keto-4-pentenoate hydratase/2-oxohepta-3-ene-1,7-dioic acid hydratase in catechol pathway
MRIVVFGPRRRVGSWEGDEVVDLNLACAKYLHEHEGERQAHAMADALVPPHLLEFIEGDERSLDYARRSLEYLNKEAADKRGVNGGRLVLNAGQVQLHPPIAKPGAPIACMGANYVDHSLRMAARRGKVQTREEALAEARQGGLALGNRVGGFWKLTDSIVGHEGEVMKPNRTQRFDYEGEVAIVIGKKAKNMPADKLMDHVWGVTTCVDWSIRDSEDQGNRTFRHAKNFDNSVSLGPSVVVGELDPENTDMESRVNGELRQHYNSSGMTFSFSEIVDFLSHQFSLHPGFILSGGCGPGTAMESGDPAQFLKPGDVVEYTNPRIGTLRNRIIEEKD